MDNKNNAEASNITSAPMLPTQNHYRQKIIIIGFLLFLAIVSLCFFSYYLGTKSLSPISASQNIAQVTNMPSTIPNPTPEDKISELVTYKLPPGWKEEKYVNSLYNNYILALSSPNLSKSCCGGPDVPATGVSIEYIPIEKAQALENEYNEVIREMEETPEGRQELSNLKKITIAGLPAISYIYDFEGHEHTYKIWSPKYLWTVTVFTQRPEDETKNLQDINYILESFRFVK